MPGKCSDRLFERPFAEQLLFRYRAVVLAPSWHCDARCRHCYIPARLRKQDDYHPRMLKSILAGLPESVRVVGLTGGELFLHLDRFMQLLSLVSASGRVATVVTNGLWAADHAVARDVLAETYRRGLRGFCVSLDDYHRPSLPEKTAILLLEQARQLGMAVNMKGVGKQSRKKLRRVQASGVFEGNTNVKSVFSLENVGSAAKAGRDRVRPIVLDNCQSAMEPLVTPDGQVYACCTSRLFEIQNPVLQIGQTGEQPIRKILSRASADYFLAAVIALGPAGILRLAGRKVPARKQIGSRCSLCVSVLNDRFVVRAVCERISSEKKLRKELAGRLMVYQECYLPSFPPQVWPGKS